MPNDKRADRHGPARRQRSASPANGELGHCCAVEPLERRVLLAAVVVRSSVASEFPSGDLSSIIPMPVDPSPAVTAPATDAAPDTAANVTFPAPGSETVVLPSAWGALAPTTVNNPTTLDQFYNDGSDFSYPIILDTGSSSNLMSWTVQSSFSVPLSGNTFSDTGIGGPETFNVTDPVQALLAPTNTDGDDPTQFQSVGDFTNEANTETLYEDLGIYFDIDGTPVLNNQVMEILPQNINDLISQGGVNNQAETHLLSSMPTNLPTSGVYSIPLTYQDFVGTVPSTAPTHSLNPTVSGVTATLGTNSVSTSWLLDTGAATSIVTRALAQQLGINLSSAPLYSIDVLGAGDAIVTMDAYQLDSLSIPMTGGGNLIYQKPVVFVPETNSLPAGLVGVLGSNLFEASTNSIDQTSGEATNQQASLYKQIYIDDAPGDTPQLVLVAASAPAPTASKLLLVQIPTSAGAGGAFGGNNGIQVLVENSSGGVATSDTSTVTLTLSGGTFAGGGSTATAVVSGGLATFNNLAIDAPGTYTLTASDGTLTSAVSDSFTIAAIPGLSSDAAANFTVTGASGSQVLTLLAGSVTLWGNMNTPMPALTLNVSNSASVLIEATQQLASLTLSGNASVALAPGGQVTLVTSSLTVAPSATLDMADDYAIVSYPSGQGTATLATFNRLLHSGFAYGPTGFWDGTGIDSSVAAGNSLHNLGVGAINNTQGGAALYSTFGNQPAAPDSILIHTTLIGSADLSNSVTLDDLNRLASGFGQSTTNGWYAGDFEYTGLVNLDDLNDFAGNFGQSIAGDSPSVAPASAVAPTSAVAPVVMAVDSPPSPLDPPLPDDTSAAALVADPPAPGDSTATISAAALPPINAVVSAAVSAPLPISSAAAANAVPIPNGLVEPVRRGHRPARSDIVQKAKRHHRTADRSDPT